MVVFLDIRNPGFTQLVLHAVLYVRTALLACSEEGNTIMITNFAKPTGFRLIYTSTPKISPLN